MNRLPELSLDKYIAWLRIFGAIRHMLMGVVATVRQTERAKCCLTLAVCAL